MTKKVVSYFPKKIGVTPSITAPGDTNPSDATASLFGTIGKISFQTPERVSERLLLRGTDGGLFTVSYCVHVKYKTSMSDCTLVTCHLYYQT